MNGYKKEEVKRDICKSHTIRSDREPFRVCPSKLSKRELEDLYFTVLENNVDLKRTINGQEDKIKALSTKVQRMTVAQRIAPGGRDNECCSNVKAMVNEQKQSIADLKKANERLSERVRVLNMRLCSTKQFLKRSPASSMSRCTKCCAQPTSLKNSSVSVLHPKTDNNSKSPGASGQHLDKDGGFSNRTVETETEQPEKEDPEKLCDENKCRSQIEELKQKIVDLQEELSKSHEDYSTRISRLEEEVVELRAERERSKTQRVSSEQQLQLQQEQADRLAARLRAAEAHYGELSMELAIEKRKVAELETRVKAVDMSVAVAKTIEEHLGSIDQIKNEIENQGLQTARTDGTETAVSPYFSPRDKSSSRLEVPGETPGLSSDATEQADENKVSKVSDDSGFVAESPDAEKNNKVLKNLNEELGNRITFLQEQLNMLKLSASRSGEMNREPSRALRYESPPNSPRPPQDNDAESTPRATPYDRPTVEMTPIIKSKGYLIVRPDADERKSSKFSAVERKGLSSSLPFGPEDSKVSRKVSINTSYRHVLPAEDSKYVKETKEAFLKAQSSQPLQYNSDLEPKSSADVPTRRPSKDDAHNSMQIPGPLPVDDVKISGIKPVESSRKRHRNRNDESIPNSSKKDSKDSNDSNMSHVKEVVSLDLDDGGFDAQPSQEQPLERSFSKTLPVDGPYPRKNLLLGESSVQIAMSKRLLDEEAEKDEENGGLETGTSTSRSTKLADKEGDEADLIKVAGPSLIDKSMEDQMSYFVPTAMRSDAAQDNGEQIELCGRFARVCTCAGARRRDVAVFRTCSGTLRFRTTPPLPAPLKMCPCAPAGIPPMDDEAEDTVRCDKDTQTDAGAPQDGPRNRSATYSKEDAKTYSVPPASPDNTDCEISTLTDLPSEKEGDSPRALSPGEEKPTSTFTETYSAPTNTEYGTLSEGELPGVGGGRKLSVGEAKVNFQEKLRRGDSSPATVRMEEALAAIGEELALCRDLLQARPARTAAPAHQEKACKDASLMTELNPGPIALKRAAASPRIGDAFTPKCIFTLHIGTVVLSDEAVINSRNMSLVLTWKFYDQNVTMTRMKAGRVVLFDFSTEYDVKITDQFLNYMKHDEIQLLICELDNQWEPFASCALRLRDALLHTNRRADMSLALMAGPQLRQARAAKDDLDSGDEVGVLDLWCMLRVDPALLPVINRAIARSSSPLGLPERRGSASGCSSGSRASRQVRPSGARYMAQVTAEDHSAEDHLSQDLDIRLKRLEYTAYDAPKRLPDNISIGSLSRHAAPSPMATGNRLSLKPKPDISVGKEKEERRSSFVKDSDTDEESAWKEHQDYNIGSEARRHSSTKSPADEDEGPRSDPPHEWRTRPTGPPHMEEGSSMRSNPSKIIVNEVTTKIRSAYEVKQALDASQDAVSQTHSGGSSWRGLVTRRLIPKPKRRSSGNSTITTKTEDVKGTFPSFFKYYSRDASVPRMSKCSKGSPAPIMRNSTDIAEPTELTRAARTENTSKKSVTYTDWEKDNTVYYDPSEDQVGQSIEITVMWLALNEECDAMTSPSVQRLYVAYSFLGRSGADLETPLSLPKPASYVDKCFFQFSKTFQLNDCDLPLLGHMAKCRSAKKTKHDPRDCVVFSVISEPPEDPLGLESCEDIGYAYLYLGDLVEYSAGSDTYTEVIPVVSARAGEPVCGVLAVKLDGLDVLRRCALLADDQRAPQA